MKTAILYTNLKRHMTHLAKMLDADLMSIPKQSTKIPMDLSEYDRIIVQYGYVSKKISPNFLRFWDLNRESLRNADHVLTYSYTYDMNELMYAEAMSNMKREIEQHSSYFKIEGNAKTTHIYKRDAETAECIGVTLSLANVDLEDAFTGNSIVVLPSKLPVSSYGYDVDRAVVFFPLIGGFVGMTSGILGSSVPLAAIGFVCGMISFFLLFLAVEILLTKGGYILSRRLRLRNGELRDIPGRKRSGHIITVIALILLITPFITAMVIM